ncbi:phasin family protein [Desulfosediminicola flagellatus]|uniref:phasin family protein n=1 Tax=Desulfosediminicola flagellatus TaxID=2569541 RepID=UPI0010ABE874|nr:phasin family protein [Desulfosediminicola flagellatus]
MYTEAFKTFTEQAEKSLSPMTLFNKMMAKNIEQMTELQVNAVRAYSELGVNQIKAATEIKDVTSLASFNSSQLATLAKISEQVSEDSKKIQDIAQEFKDELDALVSENTKATDKK